MNKAYICLFVSFSVKAVHLEAVTDLTTKRFLAALLRFISRRGNPYEIVSDNGSNFTGAAKNLTDAHRFAARKDVQADILAFTQPRKIRWSFNPERAPHFGGLWESAVKSTKHHLRRLMGSARLTFEVFATVLTQVEACLNSVQWIATNLRVSTF